MAAALAAELFLGCYLKLAEIAVCALDLRFGVKYN